MTVRRRVQPSEPLLRTIKAGSRTSGKLYTENTGAKPRELWLRDIGHDLKRTPVRTQGLHVSQLRTAYRPTKLHLDIAIPRGTRRSDCLYLINYSN